MEEKSVLDGIYRFPASAGRFCSVMNSHQLKVAKKYDKSQHEVYESIVNKNNKPIFMAMLYIAAAPELAKDFFAQCLDEYHMMDGLAGEENNLMSVCKVCEDGIMRTVSIIHNTVLYTMCIPETEAFMWAVVYELGYLPGHTPLFDLTIPDLDGKEKDTEEKTQQPTDNKDNNSDGGNNIDGTKC